jgi:hypothetical protein
LRNITNRVLEILNAWYHIVVAIDTTQATASDRIKNLCNGEEETVFLLIIPSQNISNSINNIASNNR